jgi:hypothetical protein
MCFPSLKEMALIWARDGFDMAFIWATAVSSWHLAWIELAPYMPVPY